MKKIFFKRILIGITVTVLIAVSGGCAKAEIETEGVTMEAGVKNEQSEEQDLSDMENESIEDEKIESQSIEVKDTEVKDTEDISTENESQEKESKDTENKTQEQENNGETRTEKTKVIQWNPEWKYADNSAIHTDPVTLYYAEESISKGITVCVNAGHGTSGGSRVSTLCHPDGSPKVTGGSTGEGQTKSTAVAGGTTMNDGTPEAEVTLKLAQIVKERLLEEGYHVLMIREDGDAQLDNIARTVMANQNADCHIALHYDSTESDKGVFYIGVPDVASYRSMEPVASHWKEHNQLGESLIEGMKRQSVKIFGEGSINLDLTQTSYSTVPSVDLEVGDRASDYSRETLEKLADGITEGLNLYF